MQIPLGARCLSQSIDPRVVDQFQRCDQADKATALADAMTIWELIKDCFNHFNHYRALSFVFDLVQLAKANNRPDATWAQHSEAVSRIDALQCALSTLVADVFSVKTFSVFNPARTEYVVGLFNIDELARWNRDRGFGGPPALLEISFTLLDDPNILAIWHSIELSILPAQKLNALIELQKVFEVTVGIEQRYQSFLTLTRIVRDQNLFHVVQTKNRNPQTFTLELVIGQVVVAADRVSRNSQFAHILPRRTNDTGIRGDGSPLAMLDGGAKTVRRRAESIEHADEVDMDVRCPRYSPIEDPHSNSSSLVGQAYDSTGMGGNADQLDTDLRQSNEGRREMNDLKFDSTNAEPQEVDVDPDQTSRSGGDAVHAEDDENSDRSEDSDNSDPSSVGEFVDD